MTTRGSSLSPTLGIIQYLSIPPAIPIHILLKLSTDSTYYVSTQPIKIVHDSVSEPISTYVCPKSKFF